MVLLGAPGAGKGTYARFIVEAFQIPSISTGDLVRAEIKAGTETGQKIKAIASTGGFVDDATMIALLEARIREPDCSRGFILDGFPRTLEQARQLDLICKVTIVLNIEMLEAALLLTTTGRRACKNCGQAYNVADIQVRPLTPSPPCTPPPPSLTLPSLSLSLLHRSATSSCPP